MASVLSIFVNQELAVSVLTHAKVEYLKFPSEGCYIPNYIMEVPSTPKHTEPTGDQRLQAYTLTPRDGVEFSYMGTDL